MAPRELAEREAYPWCGHIAFEEPPEKKLCFVAAVLGGRPAEISATVFGVEGGEGLWVYRFSGSGAVSFYGQSIDSEGVADYWYSTRVTMTLGVEGPMYWSVEGIDDTFVEFR